MGSPPLRRAAMRQEEVAISLYKSKQTVVLTGLIDVDYI